MHVIASNMSPRRHSVPQPQTA